MARKAVLLLLLAAGCGQASAPAIAGSWREQSTSPGSFYEMTLLADGKGIAGTGVAHLEAGPDQPFTVAGTAADVTFTFASGRPDETYGVVQPDPADLRLVGPQRTIVFNRVQ